VMADCDIYCDTSLGNEIQVASILLIDFIILYRK
jgi:hypothetical protein